MKLNISFNQYLVAALFVWIVGDVGTTYIAFMMGGREGNPVLSHDNIFEILILKCLAAIVIYQIFNLNIVKTNTARYIGLAWLFLVGFALTTWNTYQIIQAL
jgi:hypothetical protein